VRRFVESSASDVVGCSPFFDQMAFYRNIFVQAANQHPGLGPVMRECLAALAPGLDMDTLVMDSSDSLFCNFFAARPAFWREWLGLGERLFSTAENRADPRGARLNALVAYGSQRAPAKVFVIERLASLLLARQPGRYSVRVFNPMALPYSAPETVPHALRLQAMDALKKAWRASGHPQYLQAWQAMFEAIAREHGRSV
jgi:GNAT superfamily N-acetyltransferase